MTIASISFKAKGQFRLIVHSGDHDSPRIDTGIFDNIITNNGLNVLLGSGSPSTSVSLRPVVGSGNSTPIITDTSLQSFVAGAASQAASFATTKNYDAQPYYSRHTFRWRFAQGTAAGNISEVGLANLAGTPTASTPLFSRALVLDSSGNPTSITVLPDEFLDVIYVITIYSGGFSSGSFNQIIDGSIVSTSYTIGPSNMSAGGSAVDNPGWCTASVSGFLSLRPRASTGTDLTVAYTTSTLGGAGVRQTGTASRIGAASASEIDMTAHTCDFTYSASLDQANISIGSVSMVMGLAEYKMSFDPPVVKINTKTYSFTVRVSVANAS